MPKLVGTHYSLPTTYWRLWRRGFTLVELLVVISIISIISAIGYVNFRGAQDTGRDARRKSDLKAISSALVSYYQDNDVYPGNFGTDYLSDSPSWIPGLTPSYIQKLPTDQKVGNSYLYKLSDASRKDFELWANLDNPNDKEALGQPNATCNLSPPAGGYNYCLEDPQ